MLFAVEKIPALASVPFYFREHRSWCICNHVQFRAFASFIIFEFALRWTVEFDIFSNDEVKTCWLGRNGWLRRMNGGATRILDWVEIPAGLIAGD